MEIKYSNQTLADKRLYCNLSKHYGWNGFFYANAKELPKLLNLSETWDADARKCAYLFCSSSPADEADFVHKLELFLASKPDAKRYFLWIKDNQADFNEQNVDWFCSEQNSAGDLINKDAHFQIGSLIWLSIVGNCFISLNQDMGQLQIKRGFAGSDITFYNNSFQLKSTVGEQLNIPFFGCLAGAFCFSLTVLGAKGLKDYKTFLQYYDTRQHRAFQYDIFSAKHQQRLCFQVSIDPLAQFHAQRTYLAFDGKAGPILSCFRTIYGEELYLEPASNFFDSSNAPTAPTNAKLVFQTFEDGNADSVYTVPSGNFFLCLKKDNTDGAHVETERSIKLICGLSGLEYIECPAQAKNFGGFIMQFTPDCPAKTERSSSKAKEKKQLNQQYLTAWISVFSSNDCKAAPYYSCQSDHGALYAPSSKSDNLLSFLPCKTARLSAELKFPMVCYQELTQEMTDFEKNALNQARYEQICHQAPLPVNGAHGASTLSATRQGFLIESEDETGFWKKIILAVNEFAGAKKFLQFLPKDGEDYLHPQLTQAFQNNALFLVISENREQTLGNFENNINIEDWNFSFHVPPNSNLGDFKNIVIVKFCPGTIQDLVRDVGQWTNPQQFNNADALPLLSSWLNNYIDDGVKKFQDSQQGDFQNFANIVQNPAFQGILFLKAELSGNSFPDQLKGLLCGIDRTRLFAHHFGINVSRAQLDESGQLNMNKNSSMFALIHYLDADFERANCNIDQYRNQKQIMATQDFDFIALSLTVVFQNSKISNFGSMLSLSVNKLFLSAVNASNKENILILKGALEQRGEDFSYAFQNIGANRLMLLNSALSSLHLDKATFQTLSQEKDIIVSSFSLSGVMAFAKQGFDLLSYGGEDIKDTEKGLAFSNLTIQMRFTPDNADSKNFLFCPEEMSFDQSLSALRNNSFLRHFPLGFKNLLVGNQNSALRDQGFVVIETPDLTETNITNNWYGLNFTLDLGSLGKLAAADGFEAEFLALWHGEQTAAAIKIPGVTNTNKSLCLNSVIKLDIEKIKLLQAKTQEGKSAYLLMMNEICLRLLSLKFPKDAAIDFYIFGNPEDTTNDNALSWHAAYQTKDKKGEAYGNY